MRLVTITEADREVWTGPYWMFERSYIDILNVAEFCALYQTGCLKLGRRDGYPPRIIRMAFVVVH